MKKIKSFLSKVKMSIIATVAIIFLVVGCKKETSDVTSAITTKNISAKWQLNNPDYNSIEFNESGNYIIHKNPNSQVNISHTTYSDNDLVKFGSYKIINSTTLELTNYGTINVNSLTVSNFDFKLMLLNKKEFALTATKATTVVPSSTKTELLTKTWLLYKISALNNGITDTTFNKYIGLLTVLFSQYGTYFVHQFEDFSNNWRWKNAEETQLYYSSENLTDWTKANYVEITELTDNHLIITERIKYDSVITNKVVIAYCKPTNTITNTITKNNFTDNFSKKAGAGTGNTQNIKTVNTLFGHFKQ